MASIVKRTSAGLTALFFAVWSVVLPVTASAATYNASSGLTGNAWYVAASGTGLAGSPIVAAAATALNRANPWIAGLAIGTQVFQWLIESNKVPNPVMVVPRNAPQPVAEWGGTNPPATAVSETQYSEHWCSSSGGWMSSRESACASYVSSIQGACPGITGSVTDVAGAGFRCTTPASATCPAGYTNCGSRNPVTVCPPGYSQSGSTCVLSNASSVPWPSDGRPTITPKADGSGFEPHPRDPDTTIPAGYPSYDQIVNSPGDYWSDEYGNPVSQQINPGTDGGLGIIQKVQTTKDNQTQTTINNITINGTGTVVNTSSTTVPGNIGTASPTSTPVGSISIQFPNDYNKEATQQQVRDELKGVGAPEKPDFAADVQQKKTDMNQEITDKLDTVKGEFTADKDKWFSWVWTPPVGSCSPISAGVQVHGQTFAGWDICPYINQARDVMGWLFAIAGAWSVYNQMFRRDES